MEYNEEQAFAEARLIQRMLTGFHREPDRGVALIAGAMIELGTLRLLRSFLVDRKKTKDSVDYLLPREGGRPGREPLASASARIRMCHALGLIHDFEERNFRLISSVRNIFAHSLDEVSFEDDRVRDMCHELWFPFGDPLKMIPEREGVSETRRRFEAVSIVAIPSLVYLRSQHFAGCRLRPMVIIGDRSAEGVMGPIVEYLIPGHWDRQSVKDLSEL